MPPCTNRQGSPPGADHFVRLRAPAHSLNEIVERPALALGFPHDELGRVQFHHIELEPLATRRELNGQALGGGDEPKMLRQCQHRLAALKLAATTHVRPRFASLQRDIHDFPLGVGWMDLHKGFVARYCEVTIHLDIAIKLSGHAVGADALAVDADAALARAEDADAAFARADDANAAVARAEDSSADITRRLHAVGSVGGQGYDRWRPHHAGGKASGPLLGPTHCLLLSLPGPSREGGLACSTPLNSRMCPLTRAENHAKWPFLIIKL